MVQNIRTTKSDTDSSRFSDEDLVEFESKLATSLALFSLETLFQRVNLIKVLEFQQNLQVQMLQLSPFKATGMIFHYFRKFLEYLVSAESKFFLCGILQLKYVPFVRYF